LTKKKENIPVISKNTWKTPAETKERIYIKHLGTVVEQREQKKKTKSEQKKDYPSSPHIKHFRFHFQHA
jgi:hypothetical protein